jgi:arylsulfatase
MNMTIGFGKPRSEWGWVRFGSQTGNSVKLALAICASWTIQLVDLRLANAQTNDPPNIVVIMVDDMGFSDIGPYGSEIPTPHLDSLAAGGVRFSQFYNTGRCCPTRASLLTGLYSHQAGIGWMTTDQGQPGYRGRLNDQCVTIAEVLAKAGYFTAMTGKWHVGFGHGVTPWGRGFHRSLNLPAGGLHFSNQTGPKGGTQLFLNGQEVSREDPQFDPPWYGSDLWTEQGIRFMDEALQQKKPFFWYLAHVAPHFPCMAPEQTIAKYRGKYRQGWDKLRQQRYERQIESGLIDAQWQLEPRPAEIPAWDSLSDQQRTRYDDMMAIYAAMIEEVDKNVGKLVTALRQRGQLDNTLILFLSDNGGNAEAGITGKYKGQHPGDPHSDVFIGRCWAHLNNTPFRKYKHYNHEGGTATPLIAHWPARVKPRTGKDGWIDQPTHLIDIMATCVDLAGATYPTTVNDRAIVPMQGQSLKPLLTGAGEFSQRPLYWEHEGNAAIRVGDRKLVRLGGQGKWELFDLQADRTEQHDLAEMQPDEVKDLQQQWRVWATKSNVLPKPQAKRNKKKQGQPRQANSKR